MITTAVGQVSNIDFWSHPITVAIVVALLTGIGTAVGFALRSIMSGQKSQDATLAEIKTRLAVIEGVDANETKHGEERWVRIEKDVATVRSDLGALHRRLDDTISRLTAGNPEVRQ